MPQYRAAVVGCGGRSHPHIQAYDQMPDAEVVACCAPTETRRNAVAAEFGINAYAEVAEMIRAEQPDLVHLVTWPDTRVPLMTLVSDLGVPACTVEKPVAMQVADWEALCALDATSSTRFAVCHQLRWQKHLTTCREALQSGRLGEIKFLDCSAGMNISGQGTHILNYTMSLNGDSPVTRVMGAASGKSEMNTGHPGPDTTVGYLTFANGVRGMWNNGPTAPRCGDPSTNWQHVRVAAYADLGRVLYEEFADWEIVSSDGVERGNYGGMETWRTNNLASQAAFHTAMFEWIEDESRIPGTNLTQSLHEWKVILALYASALWREPVDIESFDPPHDLFTQLGLVL